MQSVAWHQALACGGLGMNGTAQQQDLRHSEPLCDALHGARCCGNAIASAALSVPGLPTEQGSAELSRQGATLATGSLAAQGQSRS